MNPIIHKLKDYELCARAFYKIKTKDKQLVPFLFNKQQQELTRIVNNLKKENKPIRIIITKARQLGISTWCAGYAYNETSTSTNTRAGIVADVLQNTENLFDMVKLFWDESPLIRPMKYKSNQKRLVFDNPNINQREFRPGLKSSLHVYTAGSKTIGRSSTTQILHLSEFAFWPNAGEAVTGLLSAVPSSPESAVFLESTANGTSGRGQEFYDRWTKAVDAHNLGFTDGYIPIFFAYQDSPEYTLPVPKDFKLNEFSKYGDEEFYLKTCKGMTKGHLAWRRWKIDNEMGSALLDPLDQFRQEYPAFAEECFISGGRSLFSFNFLIPKIKQAKTEQYEENLRAFFNFAKGTFKIFEKPTEGKKYSIGVDVAQGLLGGDFSTAFVVDKDFNQAASAKLHLDPDLFGNFLCKLGNYYNNALIVPEINNHGHATLAKIKELGYMQVYKRERVDKITDERTDFLGWLTTTKTKTKMLDDFVAAIRDDSLKIKDVELLQEMATLTVDDSGHVELNSKDLVVSACLAIQGISQIPQMATGVFFPESLTHRGPPKTFQDRLKYWDKLDRKTRR